MAKDYANAFYHSKEWKRASEACIQRAGGLCEKCLSNGLVEPGYIVHHKVKLTPANINNPEIALNVDNFEYLCLKCHNMVHAKVQRRYRIDEDGNVLT